MSRKRSLLCILVLFMFFTGQAYAISIIADFESDTIGSVPGSPVTLTTGNVTVEIETDFTGGGIVAPGQFAYLTTGPGDNFIPLGTDWTISTRTGDPRLEWNPARMIIEFMAPIGSNISFEYDLLTDEESGLYPDLFEVTLDGVSILSGAIGSDNGSFLGVTGFGSGPITGPDGSLFYDGRLNFSTFTAIDPLLTSGLHTIEFFVVDDTDPFIDTALLIDNISYNANVVPIPSTMLLFGSGLIGLAWFRRRFEKS